jgi:hypothetical protein
MLLLLIYIEWFYTNALQIDFSQNWKPGPGRFPYSHCSWASLRPSDSDFGQNWKPGTREVPLLSQQLGILEAQ